MAKLTDEVKVLFPIILVSLYNIFHIKSEELSIFWQSIILQYKNFHCFSQIALQHSTRNNELKKSRNPKWFLSIILVNANHISSTLFHSTIRSKSYESLFHHSIYNLSSFYQVFSFSSRKKRGRGRKTWINVWSAKG